MNIRKSWHAIISWHAVQPPLRGHSHLLAIPTRVLFFVTSIKQVMHRALDTLILGLFQQQDEGKYCPR